MNSGAAPRLGFLGLGWIGLNRLAAVAASGVARISALADPDSAAVSRALMHAPSARTAGTLDELLAEPLEGVVIATPSAVHAEQARRALEGGLAVFCQKPLAGSGADAASVIATARARNALLGVDMSYTYARAFQAVAALAWGGSLGRVYAVDLVFHNAYGPDKPWYYDRGASGGGALMDLGVHLIDLAMWFLRDENLAVEGVQLFTSGTRWSRAPPQVEDYARVLLGASDGSAVTLTCSWRAPAGCEAVIGAQLFGTAGGARVANVNGSFYDFAAERFSGTRADPLVTPPDEWGGRAVVDWASRLTSHPGFDAAVCRHEAVLHVIDRVYAQSARGEG